MKATPCMPPKKEGHCLCGEPLPRKKDGTISKVRVWCNRTVRRPGLPDESCGDRVFREHDWSLARSAAFKRNMAVSPFTGTFGKLPYCEKCNLPLYGADEKADGQGEVDHIEPLIGRERSWSCMNHNDNLRVLCHGCHVKVTNEQRRGRSKHYAKRIALRREGVKRMEAQELQPDELLKLVAEAVEERHYTFTDTGFYKSCCNKADPCPHLMACSKAREKLGELGFSMLGRAAQHARLLLVAEAAAECLEARGAMGTLGLDDAQLGVSRIVRADDALRDALAELRKEPAP